MQNSLSKPARTGTLEGPFRDASGRQFYRCKVRLEDGSRARVEIPESKRYDKKASRNFTDYAQEIEDRDHAIFRAKTAKKSPSRAAANGTRE